MSSDVRNRQCGSFSGDSSCQYRRRLVADDRCAGLRTPDRTGISDAERSSHLGRLRWRSWRSRWCWCVCHDDDDDDVRLLLELRDRCLRVPWDWRSMATDRGDGRRCCRPRVADRWIGERLRYSDDVRVDSRASVQRSMSGDKTRCRRRWRLRDFDRWRLGCFRFRCRLVCDSRCRPGVDRNGDDDGVCRAAIIFCDWSSVRGRLRWSADLAFDRLSRITGDDKRCGRARWDECRVSDSLLVEHSYCGTSDVYRFVGDLVRATGEPGCHNDEVLSNEK